MNIKFSAIVILCIISLAACKKIESLKKRTEIKPDGLAIPLGFTWQNSRNINFSINVSDIRFGNSMFIISIYDKDPATGGKLLSKGSATNKSGFSSKIFLSKQISSVYIVKTSGDNSTATSIVPVGFSDVSVTMVK